MRWVGRVEDAEDNDGLVVEVGGAGLEVGDGLEDGVDGRLRSGMVLRFEELFEAFVAEHLAGGVDGVDDAVGEEDDEIAGARGEGELFVLGVGEEAEGKAFGLNGADGRRLRGVGVVCGDEERLDGTGVGDLKSLIAIVPYGHEHGDVLGVEFALLELVVEGGEHGCGGEMLGRERAEDAADECGVEGGWCGLAADVAYGQTGATGAVVEVVVDVAADGAGGNEGGGDLGAFEYRRPGWHETELNFAGHLEVALHALLFFVNALVEAGVGDADGDLCGQRGEGALVILVVVVDASVFEIEDADDLALVDERDSEFGADFGVGFDVARIFADVGGEDGFAKLGRGADESFAEFDGALAEDTLTKAGGEGVLEVLGVVVPEEDAEHLEVDDALEEVGDALEEIVGVEDAGDLARDVVEDTERLGLAGDAGVEACVLDGDGHAGGDEFEQALMLECEVGGGLRLKVDDADDLVLDDERDGQLGADVGVGVDVVFGSRDVFDEERFALERCLADDAVAEFDAHALDLSGVADLEAHAKIFGAIVDEEDGEDFVVDDGADEIGDAVHEGVEIEGGVEGVGELVEEVDLEGLDADLWVGGVRVEERGRDGAVVAFEGVFG